MYVARERGINAVTRSFGLHQPLVVFVRCLTIAGNCIGNERDVRPLWAPARGMKKIYTSKYIQVYIYTEATRGRIPLAAPLKIKG